MPKPDKGARPAVCGLLNFNLVKGPTLIVAGVADGLSGQVVVREGSINIHRTCSSPRRLNSTMTRIR